MKWRDRLVTRLRDLLRSEAGQAPAAARPHRRSNDAAVARTPDDRQPVMPQAAGDPNSERDLAALWKARRWIGILAGRWPVIRERVDYRPTPHRMQEKRLCSTAPC